MVLKGRRKKRNEIRSRKVVYVLGAGFSYGTGHYGTEGRHRIEMPLQNDLLEKIFRLNHKSITKLDKLAGGIRLYFNPATFRSKRNNGAKRHSDIENLSVEEIVTFLDEMARDQEREATGNSNEFREMEKELRNHTIELISFLSTAKGIATNKILKKFRDWVKRTDVILSFNWDTLLERVLINGKEWTVNGGYGTTVSGELSSPKGPKRVEKKHITLLKLHGSINWVASGNSREIVKGFSAPRERVDDVVMMPPKMHKREIQGEEPTEPKPNPLSGNWAVVDRNFYRTLWQEAETHLAGAKQIVFIGYSFPPADYAFGGILRRALATIKKNKKATPKITIVDPNVAQLAERFEKSFSVNVPIDEQYLTLASYVSPPKR